MSLTPEFRQNPISSAAAFGRIFYGLDNRIMFSQVLIDDINALGKCYQKNDPTSPEVSDLLATDGGDIQLQNAGRVFKIEEFLNGIIAFADKGVFYVYGPQSGFSATEYTIQKVTEFTLYSPRGSQKVGDALFYVSESGVFVLQPNEFGELKAVNITEGSINSFYEDFLISDIVAGYNPSSKQVFFISASTKAGLIYDTRVQAWYPQEFSGTGVSIDSVIRKRSLFYFLNNSASGHNFATLSDRGFNDFGEAYQSYLLSQPESLGEFSRRQTAINLKAIFEKTETQIFGEESGEYVFDFPSACNFKAYWDFETDGPKKTKREVNLYKLNTKRLDYITYKSCEDPYILGLDFANQVFELGSEIAEYNTGETTVSNRINIRGTGKAVQMEFKSQDNKDMRLLGYSVEWGQNSRQ